MFDRIRRHLRMATLQRRVADAVREGRGLHRHSWLLEPSHPAERLEAADAIGQEIVAWCREHLSEARRPYGIDQMALSVACAEPGGEMVASRTFGVFRPIDLYREGGVDEGIIDFVRSISLDRPAAEAPAGVPPSAARTAGMLRFAAALLSWGDLASEVVFDDSTI